MHLSKHHRITTLSCGILLAIGLWTYWPTISELIHSWNNNPDYSHGYFVIPISVFFLWMRRNSLPNASKKWAFAGLILILLGISLRVLAAYYYLGGVDGWSIPIWCAGVVWFLWGLDILWWSLPAIVFLWFMVPLPYGMERWLSLPLQRIATNMSCWILHCLGQPALGEGNTIWLNDFQLEVEQACSGLRIFMGIMALAYVYLVVFRRSWWERALLFLSVIPVALVANSVRIVITAFLHKFVSSDAAYKFTHDIAGWIMIPFAAGLFAFVLWYLDNLVSDEEQLDVGDIFRSET
jgi:exosortase